MTVYGFLMTHEWVLESFLLFFYFFFLITTLSWKRKCLLRSTPGWNRVWWPMTEISSRTKQLCAIGFLNLFRVFSEELGRTWRFWRMIGDEAKRKGAWCVFNTALAGLFSFLSGINAIKPRVFEMKTLHDSSTYSALLFNTSTRRLREQIRNTLKAGGEKTVLADSQWFHLQHELF